MRRAHLGLLALASLAALATGAAVDAGAAPPYFPLAALPDPAFDGTQMVDDADAFATEFTGRVTGTPIELLAAQFLRDEATDLGYETEIRDLPITGSAPPALTRAVVATKPGLTNPDESIVFIAHYDVLPTSVAGTYDNASGTTMLRHLARALADVPTNRTLVFAWYNGEEEGVLSSTAHAKEFAAAERAVAAVLGFDMVGISWPVAEPGSTTCLCMWHGPNDEAFMPLLRHVNYDFLDYPEDDELVSVVGPNTRNSDERAWAAAGYPTMRWAGLRRAADYPQYHAPQDNLATMVAVAGGREFLDQGFANTGRSAYYSALTVDNAPPVPRIVAGRDGAAHTFDATTSSDADGPLRTFTWDFGDGATATGPTATHTYRASGTYEVRLTVADNLWPAVTRTATARVGAQAASSNRPPAPLPATGGVPALAAAVLLALTLGVRRLAAA